LSSAARERLAEELGGVLAALHALREQDLAAHWLEQIPDLRRRVALLAATTEASLHIEIMRERVLVHAVPSGYALSGLVDFGPSMLSAPEYEFAARAQCGALRERLLVYGLLQSFPQLSLVHRAARATSLASYVRGISDRVVMRLLRAWSRKRGVCAENAGARCRIGLANPRACEYDEKITAGCRVPG
jgi:hypothetical protein